MRVKLADEHIRVQASFFDPFAAVLRDAKRIESPLLLTILMLCGRLKLKLKLQLTKRPFRRPTNNSGFFYRRNDKTSEPSDNPAKQSRETNREASRLQRRFSDLAYVIFGPCSYGILFDSAQSLCIVVAQVDVDWKTKQERKDSDQAMQQANGRTCLHG